MRAGSALMGLSCVCYNMIAGVAFSTPAFPSHLLGEWKLHLPTPQTPDRHYQVASSIRLHVYPANIEFKVGATPDSSVTFRGQLVNLTTDAERRDTLCAYLNQIHVVGGLWALRHADFSALANITFTQMIRIWSQVSKDGFHIRVAPQRSFREYRDYRAALSLNLHKVEWESGTLKSSTPWVVRHARIGDSCLDSEHKHK